METSESRSPDSPDPVDCTVTPVDHSASCPEPCAITVDLQAVCDDLDYGLPGVRVAPAPDATWLVTTSNRDRMFFRTDASGTTREDSGLPPNLVRMETGLALTPDGALELVADITVPPNYEKGLIHAAFGGQEWSAAEVYDLPDKFVPFVGFEIAPDGARHIWVSGKEGKEIHHLTQDASGAWHVDPTTVPEDRTFTLTNDGRPVELWLAKAGVEEQLMTRIDGVDAALGSPIGGWDYWPLRSYAVTHAPASAIGEPAIAAAILQPDGLRVAWPGGGSYQEIALPGTAALQGEPCTGVAWPPCPTEVCSESTEGVGKGTFAVARTADGTLWVAYSYMQRAVEAHYEENCDTPVGECECHYVVDKDVRSATLHLVRVPVSGGAPGEVLSMPIEPVYTEGVFSGATSQGRAFDLRAFGQDLAIGLLAGEGQDRYGQRVRVLRIDTSKL